MSLILVLIIFRNLNLNNHINIPVSDYCSLFVQFKFEKNQTTVAYSRHGDIKCQHCVEDVAYPPHFERREKRAMIDIKQFLTFDWYQAETATAVT